MSDGTASPADDLLAATPDTAYFWAWVAGNGELTEDCVTIRATDETAADALGEIAGATRREHRIEARTSNHDASVTRFEDEYEIQVFGAPASRASAAFGLPMGDQPGGYRLDTFDEHSRQLLRGLLEACGTICFRESSSSVGISFVHEDEQLLTTIQSLLAAAEPTVPTAELAASSNGGYWFGLEDGADVAGFARWLYTGSDASGRFAAGRRQKLRRSVERATGAEVGSLAE